MTDWIGLVLLLANVALVAVAAVTARALARTWLECRALSDRAARLHAELDRRMLGLARKAGTGRTMWDEDEGPENGPTEHNCEGN